MNFLKKQAGALALGVLAASAFGQAASADFAAAGDPKPAIILYGPTNDGGWSQSIDEARAVLESELDLTIPQAAEVPESATAIRPAAESARDPGSAGPAA